MRIPAIRIHRAWMMVPRTIPVACVMNKCSACRQICDKWPVACKHDVIDFILKILIYTNIALAKPLEITCKFLDARLVAEIDCRDGSAKKSQTRA